MSQLHIVTILLTDLRLRKRKERYSIFRAKKHNGVIEKKRATIAFLSPFLFLSRVTTARGGGKARIAREDSGGEDAVNPTYLSK